ncbi:NACHT domain-containing protein [candidate division WOR-3 bacterium]|nr:NACHT domain-containing protein [candidate division WOR-3 bacterium]
MLTPIASTIVQELSALGVDTFIGEFLRDQQNRKSFTKALERALEALEASEFAIEGPGAIDESFLLNKTVKQELWEKLVNPNADEVNFDRLFQVLDQIWANQKGFSPEIKKKQQEGIKFFVDVLYDEVLWHFRDFATHLQTKVLRRLDDYISPHKRSYVIRQYLKLTENNIAKRQQELMGEGRQYVEPILQRLRKKPESEGEFRRLQPGDEIKELEHYQSVDINADILFGKESKVAVVADSGMGKTTFLQELFIRACRNWQDGKPVPVFFTPEQGACCNEATIDQIILKRFLADKDKNHIRQNQLSRLIGELKRDGQLLLLFDALDQVSRREGLIGCLQSVSLGRNRIILTTRPETWQAYRSSLSDFLPIRLVEFDKKGLESYYGNFLKAPEIKELDKKLLAIPIIARMVIELLQQKDGRLGRIANRSDIYRHFIRRFSQREEDNRIIDKKPEYAIDNLRTLAFETLKKNHLGQFPRSVGVSLIGDKLQELERLNWVLRFIETGDETLVFRHRSFQEFLAAEKLLEIFSRPDDVVKLREFLFHPNWTESIKFLAGLIDDVPRLKALLNAILNPKGKPLFVLYYEHFKLAALCLKEAKIDVPEVKQELLWKIDNLFNTNYVKAIDILIAWGKDEAEKRLIALLESWNWDVRGAAVRALGKIGSETAIEPLIAMLKDTDEDVREAAVEALGEIGSETAIEPLIAMLKDTNEFVRGAAVRALGKIGSETAIEPLIAMLKDTHKYVRWAAVEELGKIGSETAIEPLIAMLKDTRKYVRKAAVEALGKIKTERTLNLVVEALNNPDFKNARALLIQVIENVDRALRAQKTINHG